MKTTEEFIKQAKEVHGNKYDYSKVEYVNSKSKVCIICPEHGEFWQTPSAHLCGQGCKKCGIINAHKLQTSTTEKFIKRAKEIHGDKYDYSKVEYKNAKQKVCIICPEHGEFWQTPNDHLNGEKCKKCCIKNNLSKEEFILKGREVHGWKYDYSKVEYINNHTKVCIICPEHGEFWQTPKAHFHGQGCKKCFCKKKSIEKKSTTEEFIKKAKKVHGNKYDYSKVEYVNSKSKVCIICPEHGEFWQTPNAHLNGFGCSMCSHTYRRTKEEFIDEANKIHENKYNYSKTNYIKLQKSIIITCPLHGDFKQLPQNHLKGCGCPKCSIKKDTQEKKLYNLLINNFSENEIIVHYRNKSIINFKSIDFYFPKYKIAIEHQGKQHFQPIKFGKNNKNEFSDFKKQQKRDFDKLIECQKNNINLLYFSYEKNVPENYLSMKIYKNEEEFILKIKELITLYHDKNNR